MCKIVAFFDRTSLFLVIVTVLVGLWAWPGQAKDSGSAYPFDGMTGELPRTLRNPHPAAVMVATVASLAQQISVEYVTVGNPGNADDAHIDLWGNTYGAVPYTFRIGKCEVMAAQYCAFLNAVAADDSHSLYDPDMARGHTVYESGCRIQRDGEPGSYTYSVSSDWANRPVNFVSFWDACRFANWLHNGQPTGPQDSNSTEDGAYTLNGYIGDDGREIARNPDARVWIPSADEWYKAAYHKNDGVTNHYWDYPTATNHEPNNDVIEPDPGNNANTHIQQTNDYTLGRPYWRTEVAEFENSESPYGTYDQAGNMREWLDILMDWDGSTSIRMQHGCGYASTVRNSRADEMGHHGWGPEVGNAIVGFRVAAQAVGDLKGDISGPGGEPDGHVDMLDLAALACYWRASSRVKVGSVVGWGGEGHWDRGQAEAPPGDDYVAVAAGMYHSLALKLDGSIVAWGDNSDRQCDIPAGHKYVAIEAGFRHSLALRDDGTLVARGRNTDGQCNIPVRSDYVAIATRADHCLALRTDGVVVAWGNNEMGQCNVPPGLRCQAIAGGVGHSLVLTTEGSLRAWGSNWYGESNAPLGTDFVAITCGDHHNMAQRRDGSIIAWGVQHHGRCDLPAGTEGARAIRGGGHHSLILKADGSLVAWGYCGSGQCLCPEGTDCVEIAAGTHHNLAIKAAPSSEERLSGDISGPDGEPDGYVDMFDVSIFADNWLAGAAWQL